MIEENTPAHPGAYQPAGGLGRVDDLSAMDTTMLRNLLDAVPGRVAVVGRDQRYQFMNRELTEFLGQPAEAMVGRHLRDVMGEANYAVYEPRVQRLFAGEPFLWEGWTDYPGLGRRYVQHHWMPYRASAGGEVSNMIAFGRDLTELKLQQARMAAQLAALEQTEALKSAIVDHALAAVVVADVEDRIVEFNPAAEAMFGMPRERALGLSMAEAIIPPRLRDAYLQGMVRVAHGDPDRILGRRIRRVAQRADGSEFAVEAVIWRVEVDGRVYWTGSITDRSEAHEAAAQIERQREQLRQSEKLAAMGSLLAGVAHELNNPLAIVMGRASLLEEKTGQHDELAPLASDVRRIREAAERCGRIVRAFLNMARRKPAERGAVQLNDLVRAALDLVGYTLRSHGITTDLALAEALPELQADADQVGQVVLNLIVNAQQALMTQQTADRRLALATGQTGRSLWLSVADNGPGVAPEMRERIFEPFYTTKGEGLGTGLGLSVSRGIARGHGGELVAEAAPGGGACFRLTLPLLGPGAPAAASSATAAPAETAATARILVVDDESEIADLMRAMLESAGYEVSTAESGAVALEMLGITRFDAVVSDLRMPDIDGAALWREVRQQQPALARRMLFVTGDTLSPGAQQFLATARCRALDKPFGKGELLAAVQALLAS
jgi:two-component system NtrC family sensor kinase